MPNKIIAMVYLRETLEDESFREALLADRRFGKDIGSVVADLAKCRTF